jgi:hypothetical protein
MAAQRTGRWCIACFVTLFVALQQAAAAATTVDRRTRSSESAFSRRARSRGSSSTVPTSGTTRSTSSPRGFLSPRTRGARTSSPRSTMRASSRERASSCGRGRGARSSPWLRSSSSRTRAPTTFAARPHGEWHAGREGCGIPSRPECRAGGPAAVPGYAVEFTVGPYLYVVWGGGPVAVPVDQVPPGQRPPTGPPAGQGAPPAVKGPILEAATRSTSA